MKRMKPLNWIMIVVLLITAGAANFVMADLEVKKKEKDLREVQEKLQDLDKSISNNENEQSKLLREINSLEKQIRTLEDEINVLENQISYKEAEIEETNLKLEEAIKKLEEKKELLNERLRVMYKTGNVGYIEVILGSEDFEDLLSRVDMLKRILVHDKNLIEEMVEQQKSIEEHKVQLEEAHKKLNQFHVEKNQRQESLEANLKKVKVKKKALEKDHQALEAQEDNLNDEADKIAKIIENLKLMEKYVGGKMSWPIKEHRAISSYFGNRLHPIFKKTKFHSGIDIPANEGAKVNAAQDGRVIYSGWLGGYGKAVMIDHGGGVVTLYGHNSKLLVKEGEMVKRNQIISLCGSTGYSTGPHLHFEIKKDNSFVDPLKGWVVEDIYFND